jgi:hypothetical protein
MADARRPIIDERTSTRSAFLRITLRSLRAITANLGGSVEQMWLQPLVLLDVFYKLAALFLLYQIWRALKR